MKTTTIFFTVLAVLIVGFLGYKGWQKRQQVPADVMPSPTAVPIISSLTQVTMPSDIQPINSTVQVTLKTNKGDITLELDGAAAPLTVGNFVALSKKGFYNGTTFHRVIPDFMIQGGDPLSKDPSQRFRHGTGDPGYKFKDEFNARKIVRGTIAMANSGPNTNGSQFFIVVGEAFPHLDGKHTNFGTVVSGMDVVDAIVAVQTDANDNPVEPVVISDVVIED